MARVTIRDIEGAVCRKFHVTHEMLAGSSHLRVHVRPRQIFMFLAREMTELSVAKIGAHVGRHHSTVTNSVQQIDALMQYKPKVREHVEELRATISRCSTARATEEAKSAALVVQLSDRRKQSLEQKAMVEAWNAKMAALEAARRRGRGNIYLRQPICLHPKKALKSDLKPLSKARLMGARA